MYGEVGVRLVFSKGKIRVCSISKQHLDDIQIPRAYGVLAALMEPGQLLRAHYTAFLHTLNTVRSSDVRSLGWPWPEASNC